MDAEPRRPLSGCRASPSPKPPLLSPAAPSSPSLSPPPPHQLLHRQAQWPVPLPVKRWRHIRDSSSCLRPGTCQTQDSRLAVLDVGAELAVLPTGDDGVRVRVQYNAGLYRSKQAGVKRVCAGDL